MNRLISSKALRFFFLLLASLFLIGSLLPKIRSDTGEHNLHVHQAKAFLQGRFDIPQYYHDVAVYKERYYSPFPPFPALVLLPIVALFGVSSTKATLVSIILSALNIIVLTRLLKKLDIDSKSIPWIVAAFFLGTAYWLSVYNSSGVWFFAHVVAVTCMLLALSEVFGNGRGVLAGLLLGMAFLSRQLFIYSTLFLCVVLWENPHFNTRRGKFGNILGFMLSVGFCLGIYLAYNWIRFGNILDTGYSYLLLSGFLKERFERFGLFHPAYVPFNFIHMFLQGFHITFSPPTYLGGMQMDPFGTSLAFASPFVFIAFRAKWKRSLLWAAWTSITMSLIHILLYCCNGWIQVNAQRYSLDFLPILILLVALGTKWTAESLWKAAMIYSILLNVLAYSIHFLGKIAKPF